MNRPEVFHDRGWSAGYSFGREVLVVCPRCAQLATVRQPRTELTSAWRVTCVGCGFNKETITSRRVFDSGADGYAADPVFRLPLWLQAGCCGGNLLWAYNLDHLDVLEAFIGAKLRPKRCPDCGHHHQRMIHKLPAWLKAAKHRDELLTIIGKLRRDGRSADLPPCHQEPTPLPSRAAGMDRRQPNLVRDDSALQQSCSTEEPLTRSSSMTPFTVATFGTV